MLNMHNIRKTANIILTGITMALLMTTTAFAATSGEYKAPTREGYEFVGWYLNPEGTGDMVIDKDGNWLRDFDENARVYAKWKSKPTILLPGQEFNVKLKKLSGQSSANYGKTNTTITSFQKSTSAPDVSTMTSANIISTADSAFPVYAWYDNGTIWWYSDADIVEMNSISEYMFNTLSGLTTLETGGFDTSNVTTMQCLFNGCSKLTSLDVSGWDTSNVTDMNSMFGNCTKLASLNVSGLDTSNVTSMYRMFESCNNLTSLDLSGFDTSNVANMSYMFCQCRKLVNLDVSGFNTSNVTKMSAMFASCNKLDSLDVSGFDTSNVTDMSSMFNNCTAFTSLDLSGFNTEKVTNMSNMFTSCSALTSLDLSSFDTGNTKGMGSMFEGCKNLTSLDVSGWDTSNVANMERMFRRCNKLPALDLSGWNTSSVKNMLYMFYEDYQLSTIYASELWNVSGVTTSTDMFFDCTNLPNYSYDGGIADKSKAHYGEGGYLTYKAAPAAP